MIGFIGCFWTWWAVNVDERLGDKAYLILAAVGDLVQGADGGLHDLGVMFLGQ